MKNKGLILFVCDIVFFYAIYYLLSLVINRPPVFFTASLLLVLYLLAFWYFRFFKIEIYLNRQLYFSRIALINLFTFIVFWGLWWFLLKKQWWTTSRLYLITLIFIFGVIYLFLFRFVFGAFILKRMKIYYLLSSEHLKLFNKKMINYVANKKKINCLEDIKNVKRGFVFVSYMPSENIKTRADMWGDYFNYIISIKKNITAKQVRVFIFNVYNNEMASNFSTVFLGTVAGLEVNRDFKGIYKTILKRIFDLLLTIIIFPFFLVLHPIIYLIIRLNFGRPAIFRQVRIGKDLRELRIFKYRTMNIISGRNPQDKDDKHLNYIKTLLDEEKNTPYIRNEISLVDKKIRKLKNRLELTLAGLILRKTSIDELPQLLNVLKGELFLVGPRPTLTYEIDIFPKWALKRFTVSQGITGLWQISGRGVMPLHTSLFLDTYYALEYSFWMDLYIIFNTIKSIFNYSKVF